MIAYQPIDRESLSGVVALCAAEGWPSFTKDPEVTWKALTAPGVSTVVAREGLRVVGFAQMLGDAQITAFLSLLLVHPDYRRQGIGRALIAEAFRRTGGQRVDLVTDTAGAFYRSFRHVEFEGFRIYPQAPKGGPG